MIGETINKVNKEELKPAKEASDSFNEKKDRDNIPSTKTDMHDLTETTHDISQQL